MKMRITRTSLSWSDEKNPPIEEAIRGKYIYVDERTCDDPSKIHHYKGDTKWWYEEGKNHRVENGHIKRDIEREGWLIVINSLEQLVDLSKKYGELIINADENEIEIYDDYRE